MLLGQIIDVSSNYKNIIIKRNTEGIFEVVQTIDSSLHEVLSQGLPISDESEVQRGIRVVGYVGVSGAGLFADRLLHTLNHLPIDHPVGGDIFIDRPAKGDIFIVSEAPHLPRINSLAGLGMRVTEELVIELKRIESDIFLHFEREPKPYTKEAVNFHKRYIPKPYQGNLRTRKKYIQQKKG